MSSDQDKIFSMYQNSQCSGQYSDADDDNHVPNHHSIDYHQTLGGHTEILGLSRRQLLGYINIALILPSFIAQFHWIVHWRKCILAIGGCMHCCIENCLKTPQFPHKIHLKQFESNYEVTCICYSYFRKSVILEIN